MQTVISHRRNCRHLPFIVGGVKVGRGISEVIGVRGRLDRAEEMVLLIFFLLLIDGNGNFICELLGIEPASGWAKNGWKFSHKSDYIVDVDIYFLIKFKLFSEFSELFVKLKRALLIVLAIQQRKECHAEANDYDSREKFSALPRDSVITTDNG